MRRADLLAKLHAAKCSATVWALSLGLALTECLPYIVESLPLAREAFGDDSYKAIVRFVFVLSIALRVRKVTVVEK